MSNESIAAVPHIHAEVIKAWADGVAIQYRNISGSTWFDIGPDVPTWNSNWEYRAKPVKVYPVTRMTQNEMSMAFCAPNPNSTGAAREALANAALRHAIDADQVVPMAEVQEVARNLNKRRYDRAERALLSAGFEDLGGQEWKPPLGKAPHFIEVSDPKRDMAIAEAVMDRVKESATNTYMGNSAYETLIADYAQYDLAAIIAGVHP